jgi:hypothetical protein
MDATVLRTKPTNVDKNPKRVRWELAPLPAGVNAVQIWPGSPKSGILFRVPAGVHDPKEASEAEKMVLTTANPVTPERTPLRGSSTPPYTQWHYNFVLVKSHGHAMAQAVHMDGRGDVVGRYDPTVVIKDDDPPPGGGPIEHPKRA